MTTPKVKMRRYRAAMKRAGFKYISFWLHTNDVETARAVVDEIGLRRLATEMVLSRKGKP